LERYDKAEEVLEKYPFALQDNNDVILLYARTQKALNKIEAIDSYAKWLNNSSDNKVRYEYAQLLEQHGLYARALEEYRTIMSDSSAANEDIKKSDIHFSLARLLLIADTESSEGITEMETAVREGYDDIDAVEALQKNTKVSAANRDRLRNIINSMQRTLEAKEASEAAAREAERAREEQLQNMLLEADLESGSD
jgi:tetratricopeptide (TPR) repeat protein